MALYAITIFLSAFLLFLIQPLIGKIILPWFGGSAAVWTTCLMFFQVALLLGYLYAHGSIRYLKPKLQGPLHLLLLAASAVFLPLIPKEAWKPTGLEEPTWKIVGLLGVTIGLPYFLLSTTGPLLQAWYARGGRRSSGDGTLSTGEDRFPYRLYALSNAGSMLALLAYPFVVEPIFNTRQQALGWSVGYGAFALLCGVVAVLSLKGAKVEAPATGGIASSKRAPATTLPAEAPPRPASYLLWVVLAATSTTLLLAITNRLTQNVAPIPFLWIAPLALYLLSFIIVFGPKEWRWHPAFLVLPPVALFLLVFSLAYGFRNLSPGILVPVYSFSLFICCMICHGELARQKPAPRYLTGFYLTISLGGALGGLLVGWFAPRYFNDYWELPLAAVVCILLTLFLLYRDPKGWRTPRWILSCGAVLGLFILLGYIQRQQPTGLRLSERNFYGVLQVVDWKYRNQYNVRRSLYNGTIKHGEQFLNSVRSLEPTTYYGPESGVGVGLRSLAVGPPVRVGVVGLGTGTLASYARRGDAYRFYEINPADIALARNAFTYLDDAKKRGATWEIVVGDARLSMEAEPPQGYDLLAVDAFSSDSIPVHLLTHEAFALFFKELKPDGILAVHISNRYLDLVPVVDSAARAFGKSVRILVNNNRLLDGVVVSQWMLVTSNQKFIRSLAGRPMVYKPIQKPGFRPWTDDYSNLFEIVRWTGQSQ